MPPAKPISRSALARCLALALLALAPSAHAGADDCFDMPGYKDSGGYGCDSHVPHTCSGGVPVSAPPDGWDSLAVDGVSPLAACCQCGGGCMEEPGWQDSEGKTCLDYVSDGLCTDGVPNKSKPPQFWSGKAVDGVSPLDACCQCGGGCWNEPGWEDASGGFCWSGYENQGPCSTWGEPWEPSNQFWADSTAPGGLSPLEGCCACGGGSKRKYMKCTNGKGKGIKFKKFCERKQDCEWHRSKCRKQGEPDKPCKNKYGNEIRSYKACKKKGCNWQRGACHGWSVSRRLQGSQASHAGEVVADLLT